MSTTIYEKDGVYVSRFYGGDKRGTCFQITVESFSEQGYVQLTKEQMMNVVNAFLFSEAKRV